MKLVDLNPQFVGYGGDGVTCNGNPVPRREAVGIEFDCPCGCASRCYIPFANPPDGGQSVDGDRGGWKRIGETFETITLTPSILRTTPRGCGWHGFVTNGEIVKA